MVLSIHNPFTPKSGMEPRFFVAREKELELFKKALKATETGRPSHFLVQGDWGSGKTSLLREFKKIAQKEGSLCSLISVRSFEGSDSLRDGIEYLVEEIALRLPLDVSKFQKFTKELSSVGVSVAGTGFHFSKDIIRGDPQPFFFSNLLNLWSDLKDETRVLVVLLDDVQNFSSISLIMTVLRNVLADEEIVKETKLLFVLASTFDGWKQFLQRNHPIGRYFTPRMKLVNLAESEIDQLIESHLQNSGVTFSKEVRKDIYQYAAGHLYETQVLCNHLFDNQLKGKVTSKVFEPALKRTLETLGEEIFNSLFEESSEKERQILAILAKQNQSSEYTNIADTVNKEYGMPANTMSKLLERLVQKRLIERPERGEYFIPDPLFREYLRGKTTDPTRKT